MIKLVQVNELSKLLGINVWDVPSFRADIRVDFDEHGNFVNVILLNGRPNGNS